MKIDWIPRVKYSICNSQQKQKLSFKANTAEKNFFTSVDDCLYRGRMPGNKAELAVLKNSGISTIVDLTTETQYDIDTVENLGMEYFNLHFSSEPSRAILDQFFAIVDNAKENGKKIYVHCVLGQLRTGLMVNLYKLYNNMPVEGINSTYARMIFDRYKGKI